LPARLCTQASGLQGQCAGFDEQRDRKCT
jgi:hypothetical protein